MPLRPFLMWFAVILSSLSRCLYTSWILIEIYCLWTGDRNQISSPPPDLISIDLSFDDDVTGGWWYVVNIGLCLNNICLTVLSVMCRHIPTHFQVYFLSLSVNSVLLDFSYSNQICALTNLRHSLLILCWEPDVAQLAKPSITDEPMILFLDV